jgi:hypothetical protein
MFHLAEKKVYLIVFDGFLGSGTVNASFLPKGTVSGQFVRNGKTEVIEGDGIFIYGLTIHSSNIYSATSATADGWTVEFP